MLSPDRRDPSAGMPPQDLRHDLSEIRKGIARLQPRPDRAGMELVLFHVLPPIPVSGFRNRDGRNESGPDVETLRKELETEIYRDEDAIYDALTRQPGEEYGEVLRGALVNDEEALRNLRSEH